MRSPTPRGSAPGCSDTTVLADRDGVLGLNGHKFYSTGNLYADVVAVSAVDAHGHDVQVIVATNRAGVDSSPALRCKAGAACPAPREART